MTLCVHLLAVKRGQLSLTEDVHPTHILGYNHGMLDDDILSREDNISSGPGLCGVDEETKARVENYFRSPDDNDRAFLYRPQRRVTLQRIKTEGLAASPNGCVEEPDDNEDEEEPDDNEELATWPKEKPPEKSMYASVLAFTRAWAKQLAHEIATPISGDSQSQWESDGTVLEAMFTEGLKKLQISERPLHPNHKGKRRKGKGERRNKKRKA